MILDMPGRNCTSVEGGRLKLVCSLMSYKNGKEKNSYLIFFVLPFSRLIFWGFYLLYFIVFILGSEMLFILRLWIRSKLSHAMVTAW